MDAKSTQNPITEFDAPQPVHWNKYLINGELRTWEGEFEQVYSPMGPTAADGTVSRIHLGHSPTLSTEIGLEALAAAKAAYNHGRGEWPTMKAADRIETMEKFLGRMKEKREEVSTMLMWEIAKKKSDAYKEFDRTVEYIQDTLEEYKELNRRGSHVASKAGVVSQIRRGPLGVVLCLGPYNYPLNETFALFIPAILMGNTVVFKPAKHGVLLLTYLMDAMAECFPAGAVNVVFGRGRTLAGPIMKTGDVDVLAFIGNSKSSNALAAQHPKPNRLRQVLSLEAKNPAIVFDDADVDTAVKQCVNGALSYNGQRCTALKLLFVHKSISEEFRKKFVATVDELALDHPFTDAPLTPLPTYNKVDEMQEYVDDAVAKGAKVINKRAGRATDTSFYPAVLFPVDNTMRIYHEEQFGPVVPIVEYENLEEVMECISMSDYGQQCSLFSANHSTVAYAVDNMVNQVCRVNINVACQRGPDHLPFTGRKDSAMATLSVHDALRSFSIRTLVASGTSDKGLVGDIISSGESNFMTTDYLL